MSAAKVLGAAAAILLIGCSVPKEAGFPDVSKAVEPRTGHKIFWNRGGEADAAVANAVRKMLEHELSAAEAVQIALLNNRSLQATYEELSISQADLVQAGLLQNPTLMGGIHFPIRPAPVEGLSGPTADIGIEHDFLSLLLLPARKRVAASAFEATKLRVGGEVVELAYRVRAAYFTLQGAMQIAAMRELVLDAAEASVDLARRQHEAENVSDLDFENEQNAYDQLELDLRKSQAEVVSAREALTRLMGLWGVNASWKIQAQLPDLPADDPPLDHAESTAIAQRLDVAAARQEAQTRSHALAMAKNWRWLGGASLGAEYLREPEGTFVGPNASIELPIFDQKQAAIARLEAELRQAQARLAALSVDARSEVREARARVGYSRNLVEHYRAVVIPRRERIVALTQEQYNAMLVGVYQLLVAKQNEVSAYREYIEAVRDYWIARSDLDRSAGGRLAGPGGKPVAPLPGIDQEEKQP
jgi:outer membrane protein, heavy metal efflux system